MNISNNSVVSFHYTLADEAGKIVEDSHRDGTPSVYLHGAGNILSGLEQALLGKAVGDNIKVTLAPYAAYGLRNANKIERVPAKYLKHEGKLKPGKLVRIDSNQGMKTATVVKVGKFSVDVDMNHPLAGQTISFDIEIVDIRQATAEELSHGHAHGPGGHQH
jgi:FKBP-type peptidyl-prolyl cis-trans isomerase SlyD